MKREKGLQLSKLMILIAIMVLTLTITSLSGNDSGRDSRNRSYNEARRILSELEPVDLNSVPESAYYRGKIEIKFTSAAEQFIKDELITVEKESVRTGHSGLDELNEKYQVIEYKSLLYGLYDISSKSVENRQLHREWELHLWYQLTLDKNADIKEVVRNFQAIDLVEIVEPVYIKQIIEPTEIIPVEEGEHPTRWRPNDTNYGVQWALNNTGQTIQNYQGVAGADIKAEAAWELEKGHRDVIVAVFDNGISFNHTDLNLHIWEGIGPEGNNTPIGDHGSHVAGTVAAISNNARGVAGIAGGSGEGDGVRLMSCVIFGGRSYSQAKTFASDNGVAISQNSWGYTTVGVYNQSDLNAITFFNMNAGGDVLDGGITIFAAGNDNSGGNHYPAYFNGALAVASTFNRDRKSGFSNYGAWVDISAPGSLIVNATRTGYSYMSGTSMACPHVSGVAALIVSFAYRNGTILTRDQLHNILVDTADNIDAQNPNHIGLLGSGRVNAHRALLEVLDVYLGIHNPETFTATAAGQTEIDLQWETNEDENEVMIIWSRNPALGRPVNYTLYNIGHNIPGGGNVLYKGTETGFNHTELDAGRTFYYRAFSYTDDFDYSHGISANATTHAPTYSLPFLENFDLEDELPACWQIVDFIGNGQVWKIGRMDGGIEGTTGNYAYINSSEYNPEHSQNSELITPMLDLSEYESVTLTFKHHFLSAASTNATLFYSINGGTNWQFLNMWTTDTDNPATYAKIIPELGGQSQVKVKWRFFGRNAQHWNIDDIELYETVYFPPINIEAIAGENVVNLLWDTPQDVDSLRFNVYRDNILINEEPLSETAYEDTDVEGGVTYTYLLTTVYPDGESLPSNPVYATPENPGEPDEYLPPRNLTFSTEGYDVLLSWMPPAENDREDFLGYIVYRDELAVTVEAITDTSYIDEDLTPDNTYMYYITALYEIEESKPSNIIEVKLVYIYKDTSPLLPVTSLGSNYPNPFNPETTISFNIGNDGPVTLEIFNIKGNRIVTLINKSLTSGTYKVVWDGKTNDGSDAGSGIYFYKLTADGFNAAKKMILMK